MGAWGHETFENDTAMDWVIELEQNRGTVFLSESLDDGVDEDALAAAEVIAAVRGCPAAKLPEAVSQWVAANPASIGEGLLVQAREAVTRVRNDSELRELWEETTWVESWEESVDDLLKRLET
jgi:hypothetical protein